MSHCFLDTLEGFAIASTLHGIVSSVPRGCFTSGRHFTVQIFKRLGIELPAALVAVTVPIVSCALEQAVPSTTNVAPSVVIKAKKKDVADKIDRKVYDVQNDPHAQSGLISNVLVKIPSVSITADGNIALRGDINVVVMIDGKIPANGNSAIKTQPAAQVDRIEVMTNPSAEFSPDGTAGIINIITKKADSAGLSGDIEGEASTLDTQFMSGSMSYNRGAWTFDGKIDIGHSNDRIRRETSEFFPSLDGGKSIVGKVKGRSLFSYSKASTSVNYALSEEDAINISFQKYSDRYINNGKDNEIYYQAGVFSNYRDIDNDGFSNHATSDFDVAYDHRSVSGKQTAKLVFDATQGKNYSENGVIFQDSVMHSSNAYTQGQGNNSKGLSLKFDAEQVFEMGEKLSEGVSADYTNNNVLVNFEGYDFAFLVPRDGFNHNLKAERTLLSAYITFQYPLRAWTILPGLRVENEALSLLPNDLNRHKNSTARVFPSLHITRSIGTRFKLKGSYSKRIFRPMLTTYDPTILYYGSSSAYRGNMFIKPTTTDSYEAGVEYNKGNYSAGLTAYMRSSRDEMRPYTSIIGDNVVLTTTINSGSGRYSGMDFTFRGTTSAGLYFLVNVNATYSKPYNLVNSTLNSSGHYRIGGNSVLSYKLRSGDKIEANFTFSGRKYGLQGYDYPEFGFDLNYSKTFKRNLNINFDINDIFNTSGSRSLLLSEDVRQSIRTLPSYRSLKVGLSYKFN